MAAVGSAVASYRELLIRDGVLYQGDPAANAVRIPTQRDGLEGVQVIRWQEHDGVLQYIQSLLRDVPEDRLAALEGAVTRLNHALAWPGLDLHHAGRLVCYRLVLPLAPRGSVEPREVRACFGAAVRAGALLTPALRRVIAGEVAPADVVAEVRQALGAESAEPPPLVFDVDR